MFKGLFTPSYGAQRLKEERAILKKARKQAARVPQHTMTDAINDKFFGWGRYESAYKRRARAAREEHKPPSNHETLTQRIDRILNTPRAAATITLAGAALVTLAYFSKPEAPRYDEPTTTTQATTQTPNSPEEMLAAARAYGIDPRPAQPTPPAQQTIPEQPEPQGEQTIEWSGSWNKEYQGLTTRGTDSPSRGEGLIAYFTNRGVPKDIAYKSMIATGLENNLYAKECTKEEGLQEGCDPFALDIWHPNKEYTIVLDATNKQPTSQDATPRVASDAVLVLDSYEGWSSEYEDKELRFTHHIAPNELPGAFFESLDIPADRVLSSMQATAAHNDFKDIYCYEGGVRIEDCSDGRFDIWPAARDATIIITSPERGFSAAESYGGNYDIHIETKLYSLESNKK